jgi:hypothetical protein
VKLKLSGTSDRVTGNCGYGGLSYINVVDTATNRSVTNVRVLQEWIESGDFDLQLMALTKHGEDAPRPVIALSQRVATNYGKATTTPMAEGTVGIRLLMALANSKRGIFMMAPPVYNTGHPSGDSIILCAMYIPEPLVGTVVLNEAVYRMKEDTHPVNTWKPYANTKPKYSWQAAPEGWDETNALIPAKLKELWTCLTKLDSSLPPNTESSPSELSSAGSSAPTATAVAPVKGRSLLEARPPTRPSRVTVQRAAERAQFLRGRLDLPAPPKQLPAQKQTRGKYGW